MGGYNSPNLPQERVGLHGWAQVERKILPPEPPARDPRALGQRGQFRPDDVRIDGGLTDPGAVTAIAAGDYVLPAAARDGMSKSSKIKDGDAPAVL
jgi:hypothetical protein